MKVTVDVALTAKVIAGAFCDLDAEEQAAFFEEVAKSAARWGVGPGMQWYRIGRVLKSHPEGREVVRQISEGSGE